MATALSVRHYICRWLSAMLPQLLFSCVQHMLCDSQLEVAAVAYVPTYNSRVEHGWSSATCSQVAVLACCCVAVRVLGTAIM
jgi:hypothetical protein